MITFTLNEPVYVEFRRDTALYTFSPDIDGRGVLATTRNPYTSEYIRIHPPIYPIVPEYSTTSHLLKDLKEYQKDPLFGIWAFRQLDYLVSLVKAAPPSKWAIKTTSQTSVE